MDADGWWILQWSPMDGTLTSSIKRWKLGQCVPESQITCGAQSFGYIQVWKTIQHRTPLGECLCEVVPIRRIYHETTCGKLAHLTPYEIPPGISFFGRRLSWRKVCGQLTLALLISNKTITQETSKKHATANSKSGAPKMQHLQFWHHIVVIDMEDDHS